jgi:uncharacterized membrane protein
MCDKQQAKNIEISPKEKADCYIQLMNSLAEHSRQTRDIAFRINYAIWALIVAAGGFLYGKDIDQCLIIVVIIIFALLYIIYRIFLQCSIDKDTERIKEYEKNVLELSGYNKKQGDSRSWRWIIVEIIISIILLVIVGLLLYSAPLKNKESNHKTYEIHIYDCRAV